ncbi:patatin-like phospholipase family protein [Metallumcola ferriviriculae]|uniref:Patatin-like phospholipase family protein n=1 Tax=Metallumcola ferriviriculae TaxID=3039180 RepID=A0AAU0USI0_9FIRM|nr:patatin-like phospholipase family protein [Desulfitibacteraceae bacterium MK1]
MFGLVLSGGGLRGAVHAGFLSVLDGESIFPDMIVGSSAGSIVAALYASGLSPASIQKIVINQAPFSLHPDWRLLFLPFGFLRNTLGAFFGVPMGIFSGKQLEWALAKVIGEKGFKDMHPPIAVVSCSISDAHTVVFTSLEPSQSLPKIEFTDKASVAQAVTASSSIPGIFSPKQINDRMLVDGGVINNCPADIAKMLGATNIIAIDLGFTVKDELQPSNGVEVMLQAVDIMGQRSSNLITSQYADLTLKPATGNVSLVDWDEIPRLFELGRSLAMDNLSRIKDVLKMS